MMRFRTPKARGSTAEDDWVPLEVSGCHIGCVSDADVNLAIMAELQHGVFTSAQAAAAGIAPRTLQARAVAGRYRRIERGVYRMTGSPPTWHQSVVAAVFSSPGLSAASHETAAHLWGFTDGRPRVIEIVNRRHRRSRPDAVVHESLDLRASDIVEVDGVPVTTATRTIVDLGASVPPWIVARCLDAGLRSGLLDLPEIERFVARVGRSGRNGVGTIRPLIEERRGWHGQTESALEDVFRSVVSESGLVQPLPQYEVLDEAGTFVCRADFAYPDRRVLIELDSERYHMDPVAFQGDRRKQNAAHRLGWTVYRFTWRQLMDDPGSVAGLLAS